MNWLNNTSAGVLAVRFFVGKACAYLVKWSVMTKIFWKPPFDDSKLLCTGVPTAELFEYLPKVTFFSSTCHKHSSTHQLPLPYLENKTFQELEIKSVLFPDDVVHYVIIEGFC